MSTPFIRGTFERTLLINYRVDPDVLREMLAPTLRPLRVSGHALAGIAFVRVADLRPRFLPGWLGIRSENALHWIGVEADTADGPVSGAWIARCDTDSRLSHVGGRLFGADGRHARFEVSETPCQVRAIMQSDDGAVHIDVEAGVSSGLPRSSVFATASDAAAVFLQDRRIASLRSEHVQSEAETLRVTRLGSSYFDDTARFPSGSVELDSAVILRGVRRETEPAAPVRRTSVLATGPACSFLDEHADQDVMVGAR